MTTPRRIHIFTKQLHFPRKTFFFFLSTLLMTACTQSPPGSPENGKRWFGLHRCIGCHGERGSGGRGPQIKHTSLSYGKFFSKIRNSRSSIMPSFPQENLPDKDIADIYAYLQSDIE